MFDKNLLNVNKLQRLKNLEKATKMKKKKFLLNFLTNLLISKFSISTHYFDSIFSLFLMKTS